MVIKTWAITRRHESKLIVAQRVMERVMLRITRRDKKRNEGIKKGMIT